MANIGQKLGYQYTDKYIDRAIILCSDCNKMYAGDYSGLNFERELWSIDQWAQRQMCHKCLQRLIDTLEPPTKKPGPKPKYGERKQILLWLPLDLIQALDAVAQPEPGYTEFIVSWLRQHPAIKEIL